MAQPNCLHLYLIRPCLQVGSARCNGVTEAWDAEVSQQKNKRRKGEKAEGEVTLMHALTINLEGSKGDGMK